MAHQVQDALAYAAPVSSPRSLRSCSVCPGVRSRFRRSRMNCPTCPSSMLKRLNSERLGQIPAVVVYQGVYSLYDVVLHQRGASKECKISRQEFLSTGSELSTAAAAYTAAPTPARA